MQLTNKKLSLKRESQSERLHCGLHFDPRWTRNTLGQRWQIQLRNGLRVLQRREMSNSCQQAEDIFRPGLSHYIKVDITFNWMCWQACQGDKLDSGVVLSGPIDVCDAGPAVFRIPNYADFLIAYSTVPGIWTFVCWLCLILTLVLRLLFVEEHKSRLVVYTVAE